MLTCHVRKVENWQVAVALFLEKLTTVGLGTGLFFDLADFFPFPLSSVVLRGKKF
jgi:hypothetical protein